MKKIKPHPSLSFDSMLQVLRVKTQKIPDKRIDPKICLTDTITAAFAMFSLKFPSLLQFDSLRYDNSGEFENIKRIFRLRTIPSDTYMRELIDEVDPKDISNINKAIFAQLQRSKELEQFRFLKDSYLCSLDGTGYFSSKSVNCENCLIKKNKKTGEETYQHQMLSGVLVRPGYKQVIPLISEPIVKQDGAKKNDCERNAAKRLLYNLRKQHPHLRLIITEDGLSANAPHILELSKHKMDYILMAKPGDHKYLFEMAWLSQDRRKLKIITEDGYEHYFSWVNNISLNEANEDLKVNFLEYTQLDKNGKDLNFSWVTSIKITENNVFEIMRGGRARWKIENETFNTLKNQGYQFEHNFGHGYKNLTTNFAFLMLLAFTFDQIQELSCKLYQAVRAKLRTKKAFFERIRNFIMIQGAYFHSFTGLLEFSIDSKTLPKNIDTS